MRKQIFITLFVLGIAIQLLAQQENNQVPALLPKPQKVVWNLDEEFKLQNNKVPDNMLNIEMVDSIAEATVNQNEAYQLSVTSDGVTIKATTPTGVFRAKQTLDQLIESSHNKLSIPSCEITDWPAFRIRGFMHDVGRSFISVDEL